MPTVACPSCGNPVAIPDPPAAAVYACPHCRQPVPAPGAPARKVAKPKPAAFEFEDDEAEEEERPPRSRSAPAPRRAAYGTGSGPSWLSMFTATLAGTFLAGVLLLIGVRLYIHWSIKDSIDKLKNPPASTR